MYGSVEMLAATKDLKIALTKTIYQKEFKFTKLPSLTNNNRMRIFITGDKGFIGTHLKKYLFKRKYIIKGFDIKSGSSFKRKDGFTYLEKQDIRVYERVLQSMTEFKPDIVIHLAALAGVRDSIKGYSDYYSTNVTGTHNVIKASIENNVKSVLVASSSTIYGANPNQPIKEDEEYAPISPYGISKVGEELVAKYYSNQIPINIFRPFTVYGENGRPEMVVRKLIECVKNKKMFERYGDGKTTRGYTNVYDLVEGIEKLMHYIPDGYEVFNLGGQEKVKLNALMDIVGKEMGAFHFEEVPKPSADIDHNIADISKAKEILNWQPKRNFRQEIIKLCK